VLADSEVYVVINVKFTETLLNMLSFKTLLQCWMCVVTVVMAC